MRPFFLRPLLIFTLFLTFNPQLSAQRRLKESRDIFLKVATQTTQVVIPSSSLADLMLRDAVIKGWKIAPYNFCTYEEYEKMKGDENQYFLLRVDGRFRNELEPKVEYLTLLKGERAIITLPLQESESSSAATLPLLPLYIDLIQDYIYRGQQDPTLLFKGQSAYSLNISEITEREFLFAKELLNYEIELEELQELFNGKLNMVEPEELEDALLEGRASTVIPVLIKPRGESRGSFCYKLLIDTERHQLYFYRRHRLSKRKPAGFTKEDIRKISVPYQF